LTGNWFGHPIEDSFKAFHDLCFPHEPVLNEPKEEIESLDFSYTFE